MEALFGAEKGRFSGRPADDVSAEGDGIQPLDVVENFGLVEAACMIEAGSEGGENAGEFDSIHNRK
jgi:hypothetical protein